MYAVHFTTSEFFFFDVIHFRLGFDKMWVILSTFFFFWGGGQKAEYVYEVQNQNVSKS